ncbi:hypothetical protein H4219_003173 [Mycoemilia scoparia]|uniref:RGS domain-containing protein n=1 Tax=Mycoemilia scoparia TaxID=417184 RepID=A0A9W8A0T3_9FUNG|nr:hypothetical protein H4219_003173 [Mycoemilia scoparia]
MANIPKGLSQKDLKSLMTLQEAMAAADKIKVPKRAVWFTLASIYTIYVLSTTIVLFWKGWNSTHFQWKSRIFTLIATLANLAFVIHAMILEALTPKYPCSVRLWITYYTVFYWSLAVHVRGLKYIHTVRVNTIKSDLADVLNELEKNTDFEDRNTHSLDISTKGGENLSKSVKNYTRGAQSPSINLKSWTSGISDWFSKVILRRGSVDISKMPLEEQYSYLRARLTSTLQKERWLSDRFFLCVFAFIGIIIAVACVLGQRDRRFQHKPPYYACPAGVSPPMYFLYTWLFLNIFILFPLLIYFCRGIRDAYGMRSELQVSLIVGSVSIPTMLLYNEFVSSMILIKVTGYIFIVVFLAVAHWMLIVRPMFSILRENKEKARSKTHLPRSSTSIDMGNMTRREQFEFLLDSPVGFQQLAEAARRTFCPENVDFLRDYQYLKWRVCYTVISDGAVSSGGNSCNGNSSPGLCDPSMNSHSPISSHGGKTAVSNVAPDRGHKSIDDYKAASVIPLNDSDESLSLNVMGASIPFISRHTSSKKEKGSAAGKIRRFSRSIVPTFASSAGFFSLGLSSSSKEKDGSHTGINIGTCQTPNTPLPFLSKNDVLCHSALLEDNSILPLPNTIIKTLIKKRLLPSLNRMNGVADPVNGDANSEVLVPKSLHKRFRQFYKKYIPDSAALCVNVGHHISKPIKEKIESGIFTVDMFDKALAEIVEMLYQNTFSQIYKS